MTSKNYRVTWGGDGKIKWDLLPDQVHNLGPSLQVLTSLNYLNAGMNLVQLGFLVAIHIQLRKVSAGIENLKGRFDLLFLDRSLDYVESLFQIDLATGIEGLKALQKDSEFALAQIIDSGNMRIPGYLEHRLARFTEVVSQHNRVLYQILHNGNHHEISNRDIETWVSKIDSITGANPTGGYAPQSIIIQSWYEKMKQRSAQKSFIDSLKPENRSVVDRAFDPKLFEIAHPVLLLNRELEALDHFNRLLETKLRELPEQSIQVQLRAA